MRKVVEPHPQDRLMLHLAVVDNWPLKKIGESIGHVSKQCVSQRIHRLRNTPLDEFRSRRPDVSKLISVCDSVTSLTQASKDLRIGDAMLKSTLKRLNLLTYYQVRWKEKRTWIAENERRLRCRYLIRVMKLIARILGHTPSIDEVNVFAKATRGRKRPIPYHTAWCDHFGSFRKAHIAAGLIPNSIGHQPKQKVS